MPHACIGVDVIVGFPGETEERFFDTYYFLNALDISYLHVFTYSERANTEAITMEGSVPMEERKKRNKLLRILSAKKLRRFYEANIGQTDTVIFEQENKNKHMYGFTRNYIKVKHVYDPFLINQATRVSLEGFDELGHVVVRVAEKVSI
jgi:threonylcarbamoyladenosine tRNA methylthiotransferase MtaB